MGAGMKVRRALWLVAILAFPQELIWAGVRSSGGVVRCLTGKLHALRATIRVRSLGAAAWGTGPKMLRVLIDAMLYLITHG